MADRELKFNQHRCIDAEDMQWLIDKAELCLDLDSFVTVQADRDRLALIRESLDGDH